MRAVFPYQQAPFFSPSVQIWHLRSEGTYVNSVEIPFCSRRLAMPCVGGIHPTFTLHCMGPSYEKQQRHETWDSWGIGVGKWSFWSGYQVSILLVFFSKFPNLLCCFSFVCFLCFLTSLFFPTMIVFCFHFLFSLLAKDNLRALIEREGDDVFSPICILRQELNDLGQTT